jgi:CheY-like chemotaxis protein
LDQLSVREKISDSDKKVMRRLIHIIEDEQIIAKDLKHILQEEGYGVRISRDAKTALNSLNRGLPDLFLIDIKLPGSIDGIMLAEIISMHYHKPMIFITASQSKETMERLALIKLNGIISKPYKRETVIQAVKMVTKLSQAPVHLIALNSVRNHPGHLS